MKTLKWLGGELLAYTAYLTLWGILLTAIILTGKYFPGSFLANWLDYVASFHP